MSRYIDWAAVSNKYKDAATHAGGAESMKTSFINGAEDEVDANCATRYAVPFTPVPGMIRDLCIDLAYFKLTIRGRDLGKDPLKKYIDERMEGLREGTLVLTVSGTLLNPPDKAWSNGQPGSVFGRDPVECWEVPPLFIETDQEGRR